MAFFSTVHQPAPQIDALPPDAALAPNALIGLRNIEKSYAHGTSRTYVLRRINARRERGRVHLDHGAVGRRQVDAAAHHRHARQRVDRRVLLPRSAGAQAGRQGPRAAAQAEHRLRLPELSPARSPDGLREPRHPALLSRHPEVGAREHGLRHPRQVLRSSARRISIRISSRADSSSSSPSRAPSSRTRR